MIKFYFIKRMGGVKNRVKEIYTFCSFFQGDSVEMSYGILEDDSDDKDGFLRLHKIIYSSKETPYV